MTPDELEWALNALGLKISRKTILNYEQNGLIPTPLRGGGGRGVGKFTTYSSDTPIHVFAVYQMINNERISMYDVSAVKKYVRFFKRFPIQFIFAARVTYNWPEFDFIKKTFQQTVWDATVTPVCQYLVYEKMAEYNLPKDSKFTIVYEANERGLTREYFSMEEKQQTDFEPEEARVKIYDLRESKHPLFTVRVIRGLVSVADVE